jgi:hypothetical protein
VVTAIAATPASIVATRIRHGARREKVEGVDIVVEGVVLRLWMGGARVV